MSAAASSSSSADKMAEYRRQQAARYSSLPQADKPHVKICETCNRPTHDSRVCMVSGLLHDRERMKLIGGMAVSDDKMQYTGAELLSALNAGRIKWQAARVKKVQIDSDASTYFQSYPMRSGWKIMRLGIMYGTYDAFTKTVAVHAIYEPEQEGNESGFRLGADPREHRVDQLANLLGLQRVGIVVTHPPRDASEVTLSGVEILLAAREQSRFGDHCVIVTCAPDAATKQFAAQGWQASEQAVELFRMAVLSPSTEKLGYITSSIALEVAKDEKDDKGRPKMVVKEPSHEIDTHFMTAFLAIEQFHSEVVFNTFIRISRPGEAPPNFANLDAYFKDAKRVNKKFHEKIQDFHILIFLMENLFNGKFEDGAIKEMITAMEKKDEIGMARFEVSVLERIKKGK